MAGLGVLTTVLLTLSFAPFDGWFLAYVALVPWGVSLAISRSPKWQLLWGTLTGVFFWAGNLYWLWWITLPGYAGLLVYLGAFWLVASLTLRGAMRRGWPMWLMLPTVWVALEYARDFGLGGFPWFYLAQSQYLRTPLIQICDITGQYGVSFFVVMVNGLLLDIAMRRWNLSRIPAAKGKRRIAVGACVAVAAAAGMLSYGHWRLSQQTQEPGPTIGIVQRAFPVCLYERGAGAQEIFTSHIQGSESFAGAGCDVIVWPEAMLPKGVNREVLEIDPGKLDDLQLWSLLEKFYYMEDRGLYSTEGMRRAVRDMIDGDEAHGPALRSYAVRLAETSRKLNCPILVGGPTVHRNSRPIDDKDQWVTRNSAMLYDRRPEESALYSKMHLVPFGEYVPFKHSWTWFHKVLRWFVPPVMEQLDPGEECTRMEIVSGSRTFRIATPICFEGVFARVCRPLVMSDGTKSADILVNMSSDGWFVHRSFDGKGFGGPWRGSTEHLQHLVQYCFQAIENRVPVVRAVNTGVSASIDSNGRIVAMIERDGKLAMTEGTLLLGGAEALNGRFGLQAPKVLVDHRVSLYSVAGDVFAQAVAAAALLAAGCLIAMRRKNSVKEQGSTT
jgi:apolipoprotein N-acyltransferase